MILQQNKCLQHVRRGVAQLLYRYLSTSSNIHYSKTQGDSGHPGAGEQSSIMKMSEGLEDLRWGAGIVQTYSINLQSMQTYNRPPTYIDLQFMEFI